MSHAQKSILVVDDDERNHRIMQEILDPDYSLFQAYSGDEAVKIIESTVPDLVLLDIMMPGKDGYQVCEEIKSDTRFSDVPVIFVSAKDSLDDRLKGYTAGAVDYFVKPFEQNELTVKIKNVIDFKEKSEQAKKSAQDAQSVALQAMTSTSELGGILRFLQYSFAAKSYQELAEQMTACVTGYGVKCTVQIRDHEDVITLGSEGEPSPLEHSLLLRSKDGKRIVDYNNKTIFTYESISLLVKNMPVEDEMKYGAIKDNFCYLLDGAQARIKGLMDEAELVRKQTYLIKLISHINQVMEELNSSMHDVRLEGAAIVEDMLDEMNEILPRLNLSEGQENTLIDITEKGVKKTTRLFNEGIKIDEKFTGLIRQLGAISTNNVGYSMQFENILKKLIS